MERIALTDGTGRWFDKDKAKAYEEDTRWNGNNHISRATGSQWEHEILYRTASGIWILHSWSQWQGSSETYAEISDSEAASWFSRNGDDPPEECSSEHAALEV